MRHLFLALALLSGTNFLCAQGTPPFFTDDTATVSKKQCEVDLGFSIERSREGDRSWMAPSVGLSFGLTDCVELYYGTSWVGVRPVEEDAKNGLGNSIAVVKWRFFEDKASGISVSVSPQVEFNTLSSSYRRGLVEQGTEFVVPVQIGKSFGEVSTALNIGRTFHSRDPRETDGWLAGIAAGRKVSEHLSAGAEIYGEATRGIERGWLAFNVGAYYEVNDWLSFSASAGRGFAGAARPDYVAFFGVQLLR